MESSIVYQVSSDDGIRLKLPKSVFVSTEFGQKYVDNQDVMQKNQIIGIPFRFASIVCVFFDCAPIQQKKVDNLLDYFDCLLFLNPSLASEITVNFQDEFTLKNGVFSWINSKVKHLRSLGKILHLNVQINEKNLSFQFSLDQILNFILAIHSLTCNNQRAIDRIIFIMMVTGDDSYHNVLFLNKIGIDDVVLRVCDDFGMEFGSFLNDNLICHLLESQWVNQLKEQTLHQLALTLNSIYSFQLKKRDFIMKAKKLLQQLMNVNPHNSLYLNCYCRLLTYDCVKMFDKHLVYYLANTTFDDDNVWFIRKLISNHEFISNLNKDDKLQICQNLLGYCKNGGKNHIFESFTMTNELLKLIVAELHTNGIQNNKNLFSALNHLAFSAR